MPIRHSNRRPPARRGSAALLLLVPALVLTACTGSGNSEHTPQKTVVEHAGPAGRVPDGLGKFYGQSLTWEPCEPYAHTSRQKQAYSNTDLQCARLKVPLDYDHPGGPVISLGLLRKQAKQGTDTIGSLVMNPGGPGESGMLAAAGMTSTFMHTPLAKHFDFVGFDPRGVGASKPRVDCLTDAEQDRRRAQDFDVPTSPEAIAKAEAKKKQYAGQCVDRTKYGKRMLSQLGSDTVAKDMDVLRSALGDKKLNYVGFSYGTRIGTAYAEQFPRNVRTMVLDGAVDPDQGPVDELVSQAKGFQNAFESFAAWCAKRKQCALGHDASHAVAAYHDLVLPLIEKPLHVGNRVLSYDEAKTGTELALYSKQSWPQLAKALASLEQGKGAPLLYFSDLYMGRDPKTGHYATTQDVFNAVRCVDDPRVTGEQKLLAMERRYKQAAPFLDDGKPAVARKQLCNFWPVPATPDTEPSHVKGLPDTLVISTTHDPATPYQAGVDLAKALHGGLLTNEGTQHTAFLQGDKCVDGAASHYLVTTELPPKGKRCPA